MSENFRYARFAFLGAVLLSILVFAVAALTASDGMPKLETQVLGQSQLLSGSTASIRIITVNHVTGRPIQGASVRCALVFEKNDPERWNAADLCSGRTNRDGTLSVSFRIPDLKEGVYGLKVTAQALGETDTIISKVRIVKDQQILLTTDKPIYQPGQTMHIRALALKRGDHSALAKTPLTLEVQDGKGNKVFKKTQPTSDFGIASADFQLASEVNMGRYTVRAIVDKTQVEKKITVERYVLPKFKIKFTPDKTYYLPNETVSGKVQADYFFGKPVAGGKVTVKAATFDFQFKDFAEITGRTDENGSFKFDQPLPSYFIGQPLEQGNAFVKFEVTIEDGADHQEKITQTVPVAAQPLKIIAVPDGGQIVPKVANTIYVMTVHPDGSPAQSSVSVSSQEQSPITVKTDASGIGQFRIIPKSDTLDLQITATDKENRSSDVSVTLQGSAQEDSVLLSIDKALAKVGDSAEITVLSPSPKGTIYIDVVKNSQTLATHSMDFAKGRAGMSMPLTADMEGSLEIHAYRISRSGQIVRDTRMLFVSPADDLNIKITPDKDGYLPGKEARIDFDVRDARGRAVAAALGVSIVDESVFALQEMQPGMEKIYFLLEKELMEPKFEVHGLTPSRIVEPMREGSFSEDKQDAAKVLFSLAQQEERKNHAKTTFTLVGNSYVEKMAKLREQMAKRVKQDYEKIAKAITGYYTKSKSVSLADKGGVDYLVKTGLLKKADLLDQWGRPYECSPCGCGNFQHSLILITFGPDGIKGTLDDVAIGGQPDNPAQAQIIDMSPDATMAKGDVFGRLNGGMGGGFGGGRGGDRGAFLKDAPMPAMAGPAGPEGEDFIQDRDVWGARKEESTMSTGKIAAAGGTPKEEIRVRQFFPETMYWNPSVITDGNGRASINLDVADSITTWRISAMASSEAGQLGSGSEGLRVFQDFFIDIDLPVSLTQNDEVSIPVAVYNYLPTSQSVTLELTEEPWFELLDSATKKLDIAENDVEAVYYRIKVKQIGNHRLTVHAMGSKMSDAISREIEVIPDGREFLTSINDRLEKSVEKTMLIPEGAIDGASNILVKVYPGIFSQVVEGMDKILQMPFGCFEQTSSTTYPNILVLDYMKTTKQVTPEVQMKAEQYINLGYQRLVTFEVPGGGFSWFGEAPANKVLTAYGVMEFADMSKVYEVDPALISRTQQWLIAQREKDGSWSPDQNYLHEESWGRIQKSSLTPTAWVTWALIHSGYSAPELQPSIAYLKKNIGDAKDAYTLAMVCNALVAANKEDSATLEALERLVDMRVEEGGKVHWESSISTITFTHGDGADIETTALAALALINSGRFTDIVNKALTYIIQAKDANGTWGSTQATILSLKALLASMRNQTTDINARVTVLINGKEAGSFKITPADSDVLRQVDCKPFVKEGENTIRIQFEGKGSALYQISGKYYMPWKALTGIGMEELISIDVGFDRTQLQKDDIITSTVKVKYNRPGTADMVMVDLGTPPGFQVLSEDLEAMLEKKVIQRYTVTGRQVILYFDKIEGGKPVEFTYRLKAKFPIRARTPKSTAYLYYNPEINDVAPPVSMVVE